MSTLGLIQLGRPEEGKRTRAKCRVWSSMVDWWLKSEYVILRLRIHL